VLGALLCSLRGRVLAWRPWWTAGSSTPVCTVSWCGERVRANQAVIMWWRWWHTSPSDMQPATLLTLVSTMFLLHLVLENKLSKYTLCVQVTLQMTAVSQSWCRSPFWDSWPEVVSLNVTSVSRHMTSCLTRGRVCLPCILVFVRYIYLFIYILFANHKSQFRIVFWDVLPCKIIVDRRFRGTYCLHHPWWCTSQKTILNIILAAVRTWNLIYKSVFTIYSYAIYTWLLSFQIMTCLSLSYVLW
jgi:hypothetical protein